MKHSAWLLLLGLACCSGPAVMTAPHDAGPATCRAAPDGRPIADRGIGGTGAPLMQAGDRGIGGTGIIGVITGFASVCVAGEEVALPGTVAARMDEDPAGLDDLRAGQVIALEAMGPQGALRAQRIVIRHAVIGPVEAVGPGTMTVAGQSVAVTGAKGIAVDAKPGDWVAVSGLRQGGTNLIAATRIDPAPPGRVLVRGDLVRIYGATRVGSLTVRLPGSFAVPAGWPVIVTGHLQGGVLVADSAMRDLAAESPSAYFGPTVSDFIIEADIAVAAGGYFVSRDFVRGSGFAGRDERGRSIVHFSRGPDGLVAAPGNRDTPGGAGFSPAPTSHGTGGRTGPFGGGSGGGGPPGSFAPPNGIGPGRNAFPTVTGRR